jgi:hypothetical protein
MQKTILFELKNYSEHQLYVKYKILVNKNGTVYDQRHGNTFRSLLEWADSRLDKYTKHAIIAQ